MNKFAATAVLAVSVSALELQQTIEAAGQVGNVDYVVFGDSKTYDATFDMLPDEKLVAAMRQGEGRDHTDWSWHMEHLEEAEKVRKAKLELEITRDGVSGARLEYDELMMHIIEADEEHLRQCQLHREEEMNLYYQCTQNDINNYALHHFGGNKRSYPRWVQEYNVCIDHIHRAKSLHLDFVMDGGEVQKRPCDPQSHDSTTFIASIAAVIEKVLPIIEPIVEPKEPVIEIEVIEVEPVAPVLPAPIVIVEPIAPVIPTLVDDAIGELEQAIKNMNEEDIPLNETMLGGELIGGLESAQPIKETAGLIDGTYLSDESLSQLTQTPLNPNTACENQAFPDYSGIWIPIKGGDDAGKMLDGSQAIDHNSYTPQCFAFKGTGHQKADISMSWKTQKNTYKVSLVKDTRTVENGCMIREGMDGSSYAGWVGPVDATTSMSDQHLYGAMNVGQDGVETPSAAVNGVKWIRLGTCTLGEGTTIHKQYSTSVNILPGYEW